MKIITFSLLTSLLFFGCDETAKQDVKADAKTFIDDVLSKKDGQDEYCQILTINEDGVIEPPSPTRLLKDVLRHYKPPKLKDYQLLFANNSYSEFREIKSSEFSQPVVWIYLIESKLRPGLMMAYEIDKDSTLQYSHSVLRVSYPSEMEDPNATVLDIPEEQFYFNPKTVNEFYTNLYLETGSDDFYTTSYQPTVLKESAPEIQNFLTELNEIKIDSAFISHGYPSRKTGKRYGMFQFKFDLKNDLNKWALFWTIKSDSQNKEPLSDYIQLHKYVSLKRIQVYLLKKDDHKELIKRIEEVYFANNEQQELPKSIFKIEN